MIRTVPLTAVQAAVYKTLNDNLTGYPIMDESQYGALGDHGYAGCIQQL